MHIVKKNQKNLIFLVKIDKMLILTIKIVYLNEKQ